MRKFSSLAILSEPFLHVFHISSPTPFDVPKVHFCKFRLPVQIKNKFRKDEKF